MTTRDDWLLALDSEEEGDEDSVLLDEVSEEEGESDAKADEDADLSEDDAEDDHSQDEVPVAFDLTEDDLGRLQAAEWDVFMKNSSGQVLLDPSPLYDGPSGPTGIRLQTDDDFLLLSPEGVVAQVRGRD
ncbi:hypothetical protein PF011_g12402 [Phytophthora fragariae]|uniref:Uncharacterized protein n=1 Tax=Phytophthora fragariae TaxID=53985 RepID=A0A6A3KGA9_9STRA|nr:hypothetical protein PF011_g12402 [Phytophthora fragariae]